jgi:hypothetical protein
LETKSAASAFAGKRRWRDKSPLGSASQHFGGIEDALDPRLIRELAVATAEQGSACGGKPARKETAPVKLAHDWPSGSLIM